jgi:hypothetical protein
LPPDWSVDGSLTVGVIGLARTSIDLEIPNIPGVPQTTTQTTESAVAAYFRYDPDLALRQSLNGAIFTQGACTVYQFSGQGGSFSDPILPVALDAGASTSIAGPAGSRTLERTEPGQYLAILSSPSLPLAARKALMHSFAMQAVRTASGEGVEQATGQFFTGGTYTYSAPGGEDVGAHSKAITIGMPLTWTNKDQISAVTRASGQAVTWTPFSGETMIVGSSFTQLTNSEEAFGASFFCLANGSAGSFNIPAAVLQSLPASETISAGGFSFETGNLSVGLSQREQCEAGGLDLCMLSYTDFVAKQVGYR